MKWLATFFLCLLATLVPAEQALSQGQALPLVTICSENPPETVLTERYNELPFVEAEGSIFIPGGQMVEGRMRMFLNPDRSSYTIMFTVKDSNLHCMIITGKNLIPSTHGEAS